MTHVHSSPHRHLDLRAAPLALLSAAVLSAGCGDAEVAAELRAEPLPARGAGDGSPRFRRVDPSESGLVFTNELRPAHVIPYLYNGAGVAVGDADGNGLPDVYLVSQDGSNRLFLQRAAWRFEDVTERAGVGGGDAWGSGASFVDIDRDGDLDLYVCNTESPNLLFVNRGDATFDERARDFGLDHVGASTMPAFADYDNDGDADLYLVTNRVFGPTLRPELLADVKLPASVTKTIAALAPPQPPLVQRADGSWAIPPELADHLIEVGGRVFFGGQRDRLFRNDGTRFRDVTVQAGIRGHDMGLSATWTDIDDDGWLDLYVANDLESPDRLYRNRGDGTFAEVTGEMLPHLPYFGMGSDAADIDNDGDLDLIVADMASTTHYKAKMLMGDMGERAAFLAESRPPQIMRNALFLNTGTMRFMEVAILAGVARTDWTWAVKFADLDEDGRVDLFATNGIARFDSNPDLDPAFRELWRSGRWREALELARNVPALRERNLAFRNTTERGAAPSFVDTSAAWGLDHEGLSNGAAFCDIDRDGDIDIVVNDINGPAVVYENRASLTRRAVVVLRGVRSEPTGLGARVSIDAGGVHQTRLVTLAHGYLAADEPIACFGLGDTERIDRLEVRWPAGAVQSFTDLPADHRFTIREPERSAQPAGATTPRTPPAAGAPRFVERSGPMGLAFEHREREFDDFAAQPLLPHRHSRLGPGVAWGDADGDGRDDLFVGGAAGQPAALWLARGSRFEPASGPWTGDADSEDLGVLWLDFDGDGDQDLFVVSGSSEFPPGDARLRDRIYRNDSGRFVAVTREVLPDLRDSGSCACAADFDRDGDLDLFVGGRIVAGRYPHAASSRLLRNDGGRFTDATDALAPGLRDAGLVTAALWTDADGDGAIDLLVAAHWRPLRLFRQRDGQLVDATAEAGLGDVSGLWNAVAGADLDGDGDVDYVAANLGLNTKYHADARHPLRVFSSDFDRNGVLDVVEAKYEGDTLLPVRGRSCSSAAMPFLAGRFPTFDSFARATLDEIYSPAALAAAAAFEANRLAHVVWINDGAGRFTPRDMPRMAQVAPGFGLALCDVDGDGAIDVLLAHNFFSNEPETGRMGGGLGLWLRNRGDATFEAVEPREAGLIVAHDAKGLGVADVDGDAWPDVAIATNGGPLSLWRNRGGEARIALRLRGAPGNPTAVGARIEVRDDRGRRIVTAELHAGSGYLSQSSADCFLPVRAAEREYSATVRWPDGAVTEHAIGSEPRIELSR